LDRQFLLLAPDVDWNARDILQHDVWRALFGSAAVEEAGDIGVFQMGQDLALVAESRYSRTANQLELECFDSDLFLELIVSANGQIDGAHSALAQWPHNPVGTHAAAHPAVLAVCGFCGGRGVFHHVRQAAAAIAKRSY